MKSFLVAALSAASIVSAQSSQIATQCPAGNSLCYSVHVPASAAQSGSGDLYFQIRAPATYAWAAMGQGTGMAGSNIFIIYPNSAGTNITLSPRLGLGEFQPNYNPSASAELVDGSGISNNVMVANVLCSNCATWSGGSMQLNDPNSNWIWAYKDGGGVDSNSPSASLSQHDDMGNMNFDLTKAAGSANNVNPFTQEGATTSEPTTTSGSGTVVSAQKKAQILMAHAICMGLAVVILFPLGAMMRRVIAHQTIKAHAAVQLVALLLFCAGAGLGIWTALNRKELMTTHAIIGLIVLCGVILQPVGGILQHMHYKRHGNRGIFGWAHKVLGFGVILLGIINGGLGLQLADNSPSGKIAYAVVAAIMVLLWAVAIVIGKKSRSNTRPAVSYPKERDGPNGSVSQQQMYDGSAAHNPQQNYQGNGYSPPQTQMGQSYNNYQQPQQGGYQGQQGQQVHYR